MSLLGKVKKYVDESFGKKEPHHEQTLYWLLKLNPNADEAMQIAAYSHDIQRAFAMEEAIKAVSKKSGGFKDEEMLKIHQEEGAKIIGEFLSKKGVESELIEKVKQLVSKHEVGGDDDQNLIKDADSISFFETNSEFFVKVFAPKMGKDKIKEKFNFMFERIPSEKAKEFARGFYEDALKMLLCDIEETL